MLNNTDGAVKYELMHEIKGSSIAPGLNRWPKYLQVP